jgi:hypothetical protein
MTSAPSSPSPSTSSGLRPSLRRETRISLLHVAARRPAQRRGRAGTHLSIMLGTKSETIALVNGYAPKIAPVISGPAPNASSLSGRMGANTDAARAAAQRPGAERRVHASPSGQAARLRCESSREGLTQAAAEEGASTEGDNQVILLHADTACRNLGRRRRLRGRSRRRRRHGLFLRVSFETLTIR